MRFDYIGIGPIMISITGRSPKSGAFSSLPGPIEGEASQSSS